ncbi:hypothetical protein [Streptomyces sp. ISL-10]|nr:hypothetical protein [Streptomyces sp. ISL-10]
MESRPPHRRHRDRDAAAADIPHRAAEDQATKDQATKDCTT